MRGIIVSEPYDRDGTPGLACTECSSAWPAHEPQSALHHREGCSMAIAANVNAAFAPLVATQKSRSKETPEACVSAEDRVLELEKEAAAVDEVLREVADELGRMAAAAYEYVGRHPARGHRGGDELEALAVKVRDLLRSR